MCRLWISPGKAGCQNCERANMPFSRALPHPGDPHVLKFKCSKATLSGTSCFGPKLIRAVSMTIRFGTASSAIPLDFIDMYCFEYPTNLRYSRGVLNNISIKEYTQPLRRCGCALVCKLCCQQAGTSNSSPKARNKQESSLHFCRYYTKVLLQASSKRGLKSTLILVRLGSRLQLSRMSPGKWEPSKTDLTRRVRLISGLGWLQLSRMSPEKWEPSKTI